MNRREDRESGQYKGLGSDAGSATNGHHRLILIHEHRYPLLQWATVIAQSGHSHESCAVTSQRWSWMAASDGPFPETHPENSSQCNPAGPAGSRHLPHNRFRSRCWEQFQTPTDQAFPLAPLPFLCFGEGLGVGLVVGNWMRSWCSFGGLGDGGRDVGA
jgi:hypothetical protein